MPAQNSPGSVYATKLYEVPGIWRLTIPAYADTSFFKIAEFLGGLTAEGSTGRQMDFELLMWRSTAAITRLKVIPDTAAKNFITGTRLLVYGR